MTHPQPKQFAMSHRFWVKSQTSARDLGYWTSVTGLEVTWDTVEYRTGDHGNQRWVFPGNTKYPTIKLARAACEDTKRVKAWLDGNSFKSQPDIITITLFDPKGDGLMTWELEGAFPIKWQISGFDSNSSKVALETLEIVHRGFLEDEVDYRRSAA